MGERTAIAWTDHTFNPWIGCAKVAPECARCCAEREQDHRHHRAKWGEAGSRSRTAASNWDNPRRWAQAAAAAGEPRRVFCASLADIFEEPRDPELGEQLHAWRGELFELIDETPALDWQLLTKRPANVRRMWPAVAGTEGDGYRENVWLGTSAGTRRSAAAFLPQLLRCDRIAPVLFCSAEPLLERVDFRGLIVEDGLVMLDALTGRHGVYQPLQGEGPRLAWLIIGVESMAGKRLGRLGEFTTEAAWWDHARRLVDQCAQTGVACFVKQGPRSGFVVTDPADFPPGEWPRQFPTTEGSRC